LYRALSRTADNWGLEVCQPAKEFNVSFDEVLGAGATSRVFLASYNDSTEEKQVACKVFRDARPYYREKEMLQYLGQKIPTCVINIVAESDSAMQLLLSPRAFLLRPDDLKSRALARRLLDNINKLHSVGVLHCDLRPENVLVHKRDGKLTPILIDLGSAVHATQGKFNGRYAGTVRYASNEVLKQLDEGLADHIHITTKDDLQSLVRLFYMWVHPGMISYVNMIGNHEYRRVQEFWNGCLQLHQWNEFLITSEDDDDASYQRKLNNLISFVFVDIE